MKEIEYSVDLGTLTIEKRVIRLPSPCIEALDVQGLIIARIEPAVGQICNRNVFALDSHGNIEWQIAESPHGSAADKPFTSIFLDSDKNLVAGNWNGLDYYVNLDDGSITVKAFSR